MDINKIAKEMTREEFLQNCEDSLFTGYDISCPSDVDLETVCDLCKDCKECWENAIKDIKFKGDVNMEFDWEGFKNNKIAVYCDTEEKAKDFLTKCYEKEIFWSGNNKDLLHWNHYGNNTCYNYDFEKYKTIQFAPKCFYENNKENEYKIIEWEIKNKIDYDREYNIMEIMEFPENTNFVRVSDDLLLKIGCSNNGECKILINICANIECKLSDIWTKSKFKIVKKDKKVTFQEAIQAYGKDIYCIWGNDNNEKHVSNYKIRNKWDEILDFNNDYLSPEEIINGEWYIREEY